MFFVVALTDVTVNVTPVTDRGANDTVTPEPSFDKLGTETDEPSLNDNVPPNT